MFKQLNITTNNNLFKNKYTFDERFNESQNVLKKYPDRIPIICEPLSKLLPSIDKTKYLVPWDLTIGQYIWVIRQRLKLHSEEALFLLINGHILPTNAIIGHIYHDYKDNDGFLYCVYTKENTFG